MRLITLVLLMSSTAVLAQSFGSGINPGTPNTGSSTEMGGSTTTTGPTSFGTGSGTFTSPGGIPSNNPPTGSNSAVFPDATSPGGNSLDNGIPGSELPNAGNNTTLNPPTNTAPNPLPQQGSTFEGGLIDNNPDLNQRQAEELDPSYGDGSMQGSGMNPSYPTNLDE